MSRAVIEMAGRRCNMLTVLSDREFRNNRSYWKCRCDCGKEKFISGTDLRSGRTKSCGCYRPRRKTIKSVCINIILDRYMQAAKKRGIKWGLSKKHFQDLLFSECHYCGVYGGNCLNAKNGKYTMLYSGIDRVDNTCEYEPSNVVPCCRTCNRAKDTMTQDEFLGWVSCVYERNNK